MRKLFPPPPKVRGVYRSVFFLLCVASSAALLQGCPAGAELENPDEFLAAANNGSAGDAGGTPCDAVAILQANCSNGICHEGNGTMPPGGGVDFFANGFGAAMRDAPATYPTLDPSECPATAERLIDSTSVSESLLLKKLRGTHSCGGPMPIGPSLPEDEIACIETWVQEIVAGGGT